MKSLPGTLKCLIVGMALLALAACVTLKSVHFGEHDVEILPKAHLSDPDCGELNKIVQKYDKRIYKIQAFQSGKVVATRGHLSEEYMRKGLVAEVMKQAQTMNFTGCALQAGLGSSTKKILESSGASGSSTHPTPAASEGFGTSSTHPVSHGRPSSTHKLIEESDKLVRELKPILEKYNKK
jgi:hypothetical protein